MELRQLKYFLAVADARSFVSAANSLYITRQAVSKAISQLEAELQVELFMRDPSGAFLTPAGIMFYERVRNSVLELEQIQEEMRQYGSQFRQVIRVAFSIGTLPLFERKVQSYIRSQSKVIVKYMECTPDECEKLLREHKADLAITSRMSESDIFSSHTILESPYGVLVKRQEEVETLESLDSQDLRWLPLGCFADGQAEQLCQSFGLTPSYTGIDLVRLFSITADGQCATLLPQCFLLQQNPYVRWLPLETEQTWKVWLTYLKTMEKNTLYHSALNEFLMQVFDQDPI